jgi:hypothetical protein
MIEKPNGLVEVKGVSRMLNLWWAVLYEEALDNDLEFEESLLVIGFMAAALPAVDVNKISKIAGFARLFVTDCDTGPWMSGEEGRARVV